MQHVSPLDFTSLDQLHSLTAEEFFDLLHPQGCRGRATVFTKLDEGRVANYCLEREKITLLMPTFLDEISFLTLNRFWKGRQTKDLAALNALYVDLDYFNRLEWRGKSADLVQAASPPDQKQNETRKDDWKQEEEGDQRDGPFRVSPPYGEGPTRSGPCTAIRFSSKVGSTTRQFEKQNNWRSCYRVIPSGAAKEGRNVLPRSTGSRGSA